VKKYSLGSVLHHVLLHQSVIGEEALKQMDLANEYPDVVIGCVGGGSNFGGIALPFLRENLKNGQRTRLVAVEPKATPSFTKGIYAFYYGDTAQMAPIVKMYTWTQFYPGFYPRRRPALPRHGPHSVHPLRTRADRSQGGSPACHL
jgi:predicted alternative tryptophan synthase beta-subunit